MRADGVSRHWLLSLNVACGGFIGGALAGLRPAVRLAREHLGPARGRRAAVRPCQRLVRAAAAGRLIRTAAGVQPLCCERGMRSTASSVASRVSATPDLLDWVRGLVSVAFVLLLPLLIIGTSLRGLVTDRDFMLRGFQDNRVATTTGLDQAQLRRVADAFVAYFQAPPGQLQLQVTAFGQPRPLFTEREVAHMEDVQGLIQFFLRMQLVAAAVVVIRLATAVALDRSAVPLGRDMLWSTGLMVGLVVLVGFLSLLDFDALWTRFHQIAFRNDLWQLDPTRDYLIMLFPERFWLAATVRMATSVGLQALLVLVLGLAFVLSPRFL